MERLEHLFQTGGPKFHIVEADVIGLERFDSELRRRIPSGTYVAEIDGKAVSDTHGLYKALAHAFRFPDYFGYNWDALEECINDLSWIGAPAYLLLAKNPESMNLDEYSWSTLLKVLKGTAEEWTSGRTFNPSFPTPPTPFHVIAAVAPGQKEAFVRLLEAHGIHGVDVLDP